MTSGVYTRTEKHKQILKEHHADFSGEKNPMYAKGYKLIGVKNGMYGKKHTPESIEKNRQSNLGQQRTEQTKQKMRNVVRLTEEKSTGWKGNDVKYTGLHAWVIKHLGQPTKCEHCKKDNLTDHSIGWANKDHLYKRNLKDWLRLCVKCHRKYDAKFNK